MNKEDIQLLRKLSGAGIIHCKRALDKADGNVDKAMIILRELGHSLQATRALRGTNYGFVSSYTHHNRQVSAIIEIGCESDFAATVLKQFGIDLCMQIAATNPEFVSPNDVPEKRLVEETEIASKSVYASGKTGEIANKVIAGRIKKFYIERCLLCQKSVRDSTVTIEDMLYKKMMETGENIVIKRFCRFQVGY